MSTEPIRISGPATLRPELRSILTRIRKEVGEKRQAGEAGIAVAEWFSDRMDELLLRIVENRRPEFRSPGDTMFCLIAAGGNGRRRPAPFSDVDLLFLIDASSIAPVQPVLESIVRDCWDAGLQIGHSIRTPNDVLRFAAEDLQFATSLIGIRCIAGNEQLAASATKQIHGKIFRDRADEIIRQCVAARRDEWLSRGNSVNQLEPDIKKSPGGLRDLHLLQWIAFARYGNSDLSELVRHGDISEQEMEALQTADEFLTALRTDLHSIRQLKQDVLTRELQLTVSALRKGNSADNLRSAEEFMQEYFSHTSKVAEVARRVAELPKRPSLFTRLRNAFLPRRSVQGFRIVNGVLELDESQIERLSDNMPAVMDIFLAAAENQASLSPGLRQFIGRLAPRFPAEPDRDVSSKFRDILRTTRGLPDTLRAMYETGVLEWLIPSFAGIRCLIQFNQYHSFTVDEHTFKAMDEMVAFETDESPVGSAYRGVRHRATLHLAMLMHDVGKGREGDHSIIGAEICDTLAVRLQMAANKKSMLEFLVRHHLVMPNLAFRRDISAPSVLMDFARLVGAPELLRMLYVLTVADIRAVGPDVWSDWKGELLADLYNRAMQILSGRPYNHLEQERLKVVRDTVRASIVPVASNSDEAVWPKWIEQQLDALPPFYLMTEDPDRIARDLDMIQQLTESEVKIEGAYDPETHTVSYRVFAPVRHERGSFHKIAGILSGLRMNILTAQICTTADSVVIASFRVTDNDFSGTVPESRIETVAAAICDVLMARKTVESVFRRSSLYRLQKKNPLTIRPEPQVSFDNDCSDRFTVVDVFASDSQGLLYTLAHTLFENGLHVQLARIATHVDQVVDVFYVLDENQQKLEDPVRIEQLRSQLLEEIRKLG
ncbi:MAG: [protein-PII] uridylyltransferase [Planctomyces sp.]